MLGWLRSCVASYCWLAKRSSVEVLKTVAQPVSMSPLPVAFMIALPAKATIGNDNKYDAEEKVGN
eukprot:5704358-Amphidinium_carterae.1